MSAPTPAVVRETTRLTRAWLDVLARIERHPYGGTDRDLRCEQEAYTALCEYIDVTGQTYGPRDPRGPEGSS